MKFNIRNVIEIVIISLVFIVGITSGILVLQNNPPDVVQFIVGNQTYTTDQTMDFNRITIDSSYIIFNNTGFYVASANDISITLVYIDDDIAGAGDGEKILEFYADTTSGNVVFDLSGFHIGNEYVVKRGGNPISYPIADSSGFISFTNSIWSIQQFEIFQQGERPEDTTPPEISSVSVVWSDPIDTQVGFGWENITCTVTDNVEVDEVFLNILYPDSSATNVSMINIQGTNYYYHNTSFLNHGNYSYFIWAKDTSDNTDISNSYDLSMPPNWDVNNDGNCNVFDQVLISNHYGETGTPGWIREDVDNNGEIQVLDLVLVSSHYGETWGV